MSLDQKTIHIDIGGKQLVSKSLSSTLKDAGSISDEESVTTEGYIKDLEWTQEEEAKVLRILDIRLMPLMLVMSFVLNMDRTNICKSFNFTCFPEYHYKLKLPTV